MDAIKHIPNSALPIAASIRIALNSLPAKRKKEVLESMPEDEFVDYRTDIYLQELETAISSGAGEFSAKEIATNEALGDILN